MEPRAFVLYEERKKKNIANSLYLATHVTCARYFDEFKTDRQKEKARKNSARSQIKRLYKCLLTLLLKRL